MLLSSSPVCPTRRSRGLRAGAVIASVVAAVLAGCGSDDDGAAGSSEAEATTAPNDTSAAGDQPAGATLEPVAGTVDDPDDIEGWAWHGRDLGARRSNSAETIIGPDTVGSLGVAWHLEDLAAVTGTPAVVDGVVYLGDWTDQVRALEADTGDELWATAIDGQPTGSVAVTDDAVFVSGGSVTHRLDRATGEIDWTVEVDDHPWTRVYGGPLVVADVLVQPVSGVQIAVAQDDYSFRGSTVGLDVDTGEQLWRVWFTENDETSGAGVSAWTAASADPDRGLVFVGTGNTYEEPAAPLSNSIVAIDVTDGTVVWSTQFTEDDVYNMPQANDADGPDADVGSTPTLWSAGGRDLVGAGDKAGDFYALDRDTGEIVWATALTPGSRLGGVIGGSATADGRIFVASNVGDPATQVPTGVSTLFALDAGTGEIVWQSDMELAVFGPATVAGGVVFQGTAKPAMYAFDAETGEQLWEYEPAGQVGGGASVVDGRVYWGYGYWVAVAPEDPVGGLLVLTPDP